MSEKKNQDNDKYKELKEKELLLFQYEYSDRNMTRNMNILLLQFQQLHKLNLTLQTEIQELRSEICYYKINYPDRYIEVVDLSDEYIEDLEQKKIKLDEKTLQDELRNFAKSRKRLRFRIKRIKKECKNLLESISPEND